MSNRGRASLTAHVVREAGEWVWKKAGESYTISSDAILFEIPGRRHEVVNPFPHRGGPIHIRISKGADNILCLRGKG